MKRTHSFLAGALAAAAGASALAGAAAGLPSAHASRATKVEIRHSGLGRILVDASGFTLYRFSKDGRGKDACLKISECASVWPPLKTSGNPIAGPGVRASLLSTIKLPGGGRQVTYAGHALYRYSAASERAETAYVGAMQFGGVWYALNAAGNTVK